MIDERFHLAQHPAPVRSSEFVVLRSAQGAAKPSASPQPTSSGSSQSLPSAGTAAVTIGNFKFVPACLTVSQDTITLTNRDTTAHTTTARRRKELRHRKHRPRIFGDDQPVQARDLQVSLQHPPVHARDARREVSLTPPCGCLATPRQTPAKDEEQASAGADRFPYRCRIGETQQRRTHRSYPCSGVATRALLLIVDAVG
jgi:plastocyanin